ncbi:MAG: LysR family transcriptional regulator [Proteobacteria bacterium]|nr:MAG: LysR family transcriptional regulator [Pseudomonadota bacterium]
MPAPVPRLNYQHLLYFWTVVRAGSIARACEELHLAAPTVSAQLRTLEARLGGKLLVKSGRTLVPTELGRLVYGYADEIFGLGADLLQAVARRPTDRPMRVGVGVVGAVPNEIAQPLLQAVFSARRPSTLICRAGTLEQLLPLLEAREIDAVVSDASLTSSARPRAYSHLLGACDVHWMAAPALARSLRSRFPRSLDGARILLPTTDSGLRRSLDRWLKRQRLRPDLGGEFEDYALLYELASAGLGAAPVPAVLVEQFRKESGLVPLGPARKVEVELYAISLEREIHHPAILALRERAAKLFED